MSPGCARSCAEGAQKMPRDILIPPPSAPGAAPGSGEMRVNVCLIDEWGRPVPASVEDATVWGVGSYVVGADGLTLTLLGQDELPGMTRYRVEVWGVGRAPYRADVQIEAGTEPLPWAEFLALGAPVDPLDMWSARLLPGGAEPGQIVSAGESGSPEWIDRPAGTGDVSGPSSATAGLPAVFADATGKTLAVGADPATQYEPLREPVTQADAEAGIDTAPRAWSPMRVAQAIAAKSQSGGGGISEERVAEMISEAITALGIPDPSSAADGAVLTTSGGSYTLTGG